MKVVLSGSTGYIGGEVLSQCLTHPSITSILVLTRRRPEKLAENPKAKVIILEDFTSYPESIIDELKTADGAIWCLGTSTGDEKVDIEYPLAFINIIKTRSSGSMPFRYVQLSGAFTEPPPLQGEKERSLWFYANGRRVRGATEARVLQTSDEESRSTFEVYLVKPGGVMPKSAAVLQRIISSFSTSLSINIDELCATMVDLAVRGNEQKIFKNNEIIEYGKRLLRGI